MVRYHRVTFDGTLALGQERWSTGFAVRATSDVAPSGAALTAWAEAIMGVFAGSSAGATALKSFLSSSGTIQRVRIYSYPDLNQPADVLGQSTATAITGAGTPTMPPQCSSVITLNTGLPGGSRRGRMYWPLVGGAVTTSQVTSLITQTVTNNIALTLGSLVDLSGGSAGAIAVASAATGAVTDVTSISLDVIIDTQRRRRDTMLGARYTAEV